MKLNEAESDTQLKVIKIAAGRKMNKRLLEMGVKNEFKKISGEISGPQIIECEAGRVIIGNGMAKKIEVENDN
jgi:Fe2+ transport system protein FeoA